MRKLIVAGVVALSPLAVAAGVAGQSPSSPQTPPAARPAEPPAAATAGAPAAAAASPMEAPKMPPFAGEIVNFDRRGGKVVACVDAAKVQMPSRPGPDGKPAAAPPPAPPPPAPPSPPRLRIWVIEREVMQELLTTSGLCDPAWSPDGKSFAATGLRGVFVFTEPNFEPRVIVAGQLQAPPPGAPAPRAFEDAAWSPSGARIAFRTSGTDGARVEVVDVKSAEVLLRHTGAAQVLRWADERALLVDGARVPLP